MIYMYNISYIQFIHNIPRVANFKGLKIASEFFYVVTVNQKKKTKIIFYIHV